MSNRTHHKESAQLRQNIADKEIERSQLNGIIDNLIQERDALHRQCTGNTETIQSQAAQIEALKAELLVAVTALAAKSEELLSVKQSLSTAVGVLTRDGADAAVEPQGEGLEAS